MVNYCCVYGCGRNSRQNKNLNFYGLPKEKHRQEQWLKAAAREDLLEIIAQRPRTARFCSRHFKPADKRNRHLNPDALPSICLPESNIDEPEPEPLEHENVSCDNCSQKIVGFRYKCLSCSDYDLCTKCESNETHSDHYMIRIPKPLKFKSGINLFEKWQKFFNKQMLASDDLKYNDEQNSSDDEPISKYSKDYDSGIDLPEETKKLIRQEVSRVVDLEIPVEIVEKNKKDNKKRKVGGYVRNLKKMRVVDVEIENIDVTTKGSGTSEVSKVPEMMFADVNELKYDQSVDIKPETTGVAVTESDQNAMEHEMPVMHVKLSDDLSMLMIEMTGNDSKALPVLFHELQ